jgi:hypothetical protein
VKTLLVLIVVSLDRQLLLVYLQLAAVNHAAAAAVHLTAFAGRWYAADCCRCEQRLRDAAGVHLLVLQAASASAASIAALSAARQDGSPPLLPAVALVMGAA